MRWFIEPHLPGSATAPAATQPTAAARSLSAFQAFTVSAASRMGVGNIAGAGTAIALGGPGAVFWMWLMAFVGGASAFVESTLGQLYKVRDAGATAGIGLTRAALTTDLGSWSSWLLAVIIFLLAFSSILGNYYHGESNVEFISTSPAVLTGYRALVVAAVFACAVLDSALLWDAADGVPGATPCSPETSCPTSTASSAGRTSSRSRSSCDGPRLDRRSWTVAAGPSQLDRRSHGAG